MRCPGQYQCKLFGASIEYIAWHFSKHEFLLVATRSTRPVRGILSRRKKVNTSSFLCLFSINQVSEVLVIWVMHFMVSIFRNAEVLTIGFSTISRSTEIISTISESYEIESGDCHLPIVEEKKTTFYISSSIDSFWQPYAEDLNTNR